MCRAHQDWAGLESPVRVRQLHELEIVVLLAGRRRAAHAAHARREHNGAYAGNLQEIASIESMSHRLLLGNNGARHSVTRPYVIPRTAHFRPRTLLFCFAR